jgi:hypothetical protein
MTEMGDIDHTNPFADDPFVRTYRRGRVVAADGGEPDAADGEDETMDEVSHTSPTEGANRTFERGAEGRDESV